MESAYNSFKVGDTINAKVEPATATGTLTYQWLADGTAIEGQTTDKLVVTADMVGKKISVKVTGDAGSEVTSTETAAVEAAATDKIAIVSATQTGAATIDVKLNKPVTTSTFEFGLSKGTAAQTVTVSVDEAGTTATLVNGVALSDGEYTVTVTNKSDATETASTSVTCAKANLTAIDFLGNELILTSSKMDKATVTVKGYNQFEEEVALSGSLTPYTTKGTATYDQSSSKITITASSTAIFTVGEQVNVTAVYNTGATTLQVSKALTVSNVATLTTFELGELTTTKASLKDAKVTIENLSSGTYYLPVNVAKDQYNNDLSAAELKAMMDTANNGNLYINPNAANGAFAYVSGFEKLTDGTTAMNVNIGSLKLPGTAVISITGVGGYQGTAQFEILDNPYIATISVNAPNLYANVKSELDITAVDQFGDDINLYDFVSAGSATGPDTYQFDDLNSLTQKGSSFAPATGSTFTVTKDSAKQTVKFYYTPADRSKTSNDVVTVSSAVPTVSNLTWAVDAQPTPATISGLGSTSTTLCINSDVGQSYVYLNDTTVDIFDSTGALIDYTDENNTIAPVVFTTATSTSLASGTPGYYAIVSSDKDAVGLDTYYDSAVVYSNSEGSATITIELGQVTSDAKWVSLDKKNFKFTVAGTSFKSFKAALSAGDELLYVNDKSTDTASFDVYGVDADKNEVLLKKDSSNYVVEVDSNLDVATDKVTVIGVPKAKVSAAGTATATIWATKAGDSKATAVAKVDVPFDVAAPAAQSSTQEQYKVDSWETITSTEFTGITYIRLFDNGIMEFGNSDAEYCAYLADQYGLAVASSTWTIDGKAFAAGTYSSKTITVKATSAKVSGAWEITTGTSCTVTSEKQEEEEKEDATTSVNTEAKLRSALAGSAYKYIHITEDITLGAALTIPEGKTVYVDNDVKLIDTKTNAVTVKGTLDVDGTFTSVGATAGDGTIVIDGDASTTTTAWTFTGTIENNGTFDIAKAPTGAATLTNNGAVVLSVASALAATGLTVEYGAGAVWNMNIASDAANLPAVLALGVTDGLAQEINILADTTLATATAATVDENTTIRVADGAKLTLVAATLTNKGTIVNNGTIEYADNAASILDQDGSLENNGNIDIKANASIKTTVEALDPATITGTNGTIETNALAGFVACASTYAGTTKASDTNDIDLTADVTSPGSVLINHAGHTNGKKLTVAGAFGIATSVTFTESAAGQLVVGSWMENESGYNEGTIAAPAVDFEKFANENPGITTNTATLSIASDITTAGDVVVAASTVVTIPAGKTVTIADGSKWTNTNELDVAGNLYVSKGAEMDGTGVKKAAAGSAIYVDEGATLASGDAKFQSTLAAAGTSTFASTSDNAIKNTITLNYDGTAAADVSPEEELTTKTINANSGSDIVVYVGTGANAGKVMYTFDGTR